MFEAGFVSKSSFNTEFRRVTGKTPSQFRAETATI
jgi:AraC-like DNA-binding protein